MSSEGSEGRLVRGGVGIHQAPEPDNLPCPRCSSSNTKFCYYNNYNLSQPRYFCKSCRRYWTRGGSLRNVPVGGGSRKNSKRSRSDHTTALPQPLPSPAPVFVDSPAPDAATTTPSYQSDAADTTSYQSFTALLGNQQQCGFMGLGGYSVGLGLGPDASPSFDGHGFAPAVVGDHDQNNGGWAHGGSSSGYDTWHTGGAEDGGVLTDTYGGDYRFGLPAPQDSSEAP